MTAPTTQAPLQRIQQLRGTGYPALNGSPQAKADYVMGLMEESEADALARFKLATRNLLFADGQQHIDWNMRERAWLNTPSPDGRLRVTNNYIRPILRSRMQRLTSAEMVWRIVPRSNDHEERDRATVGTNFLSSRWAKTKMDSKMRHGLWLAMNCGISVLKSFWNPNIGPLMPATLMMPHVGGLADPETGRALMVEYPVNAKGEALVMENGDPVPLEQAEDAYRFRPGDTDTALRTIFNVRVNPDAWGFEPDEGFRWLVDAEVVPISVVKELYGDRAERVQPITGLHTSRNYERIIRQLGPALGDRTGRDLVAASGTSRTLPDKETTLLVEYWEPPNHAAGLPNGRLIVVAGNEVLYPKDGENEGTPHGFVPYVPLYDERRPFDWGGRGMTGDLVDPQRVINRQSSAIIEELLRHGIGQWAYWDIPGLADQIGNVDDAHIRVPATSALANRSIGDVVQRVNPPHIPADRWRLIQEAKATMFDIGAFHEIQRGQVPPGVDSGIAVQLLQEAENGQLHDPVRNLKEALIQWARHQLKIARSPTGYGQYDERWLPVKRPDLGFLVESVSGSDLPDPDEADIDLEGFRPTSTAAMRAEIKEFVKEGYMDPRQGLLLMDLGRGVEGAFESESRHYARARRENLAIEKGDYLIVAAPEGLPYAGLPSLLHKDKTPFMLPQDDYHVAHIAIAQEIALDDTKPWETRQAALLHINEHRTMMVLSMTPPAPPPGAETGQPGEKPAGEPAPTQ